MAGQFVGLSDKQWAIIEPLFPARSKRVGRPNPDFRKVLNSIMYVGITGCRWCDIPTGSQWAKRSTAHKWLGEFEKLGIWKEIKSATLNLAGTQCLIDWSKGAIDGSFSLGQRRR